MTGRRPALLEVAARWVPYYESLRIYRVGNLDGSVGFAMLSVKPANDTEEFYDAIKRCQL